MSSRQRCDSANAQEQAAQDMAAVMGMPIDHARQAVRDAVRQPEWRCWPYAYTSYSDRNEYGRPVFVHAATAAEAEAIANAQAPGNTWTGWLVNPASEPEPETY